jgi:hypothetical protein
LRAVDGGAWGSSSDAAKGYAHRNQRRKAAY